MFGTMMVNGAVNFSFDGLVAVAADTVADADDETTLSPIKSSVVEKLLCGHYVELAKSISVDFWLDLVDEKTVDILRNDCVNFWYISMTQLPSSFTFTSGTFYFLVDARSFLWPDKNLYSLSDAKANT